MQIFLTIFAVLLFASPNELHITGYQKDRATSRNNRTLPRASRVIHKESDGPKEQANADSKEAEDKPKSVRIIPPAKDKYDYIVISANVLLAFIGTVGIIVALYSVKAASRAADAALLNAQAVINAERAWLTVTIKESKFSRGGYFIRVRNHGNTPAKIVRLDWKPGVFVSGNPDNFRIPERYEGCAAELPNSTFIVKGFTLRHGCFPDEIFRQHGKQAAIETSREFLMVYGRIVYEDVFNVTTNGKRIQHETCWCYGWESHRKRFRTSGPNEYTRNS